MSPEQKIPNFIPSPPENKITFILYVMEIAVITEVCSFIKINSAFNFKVGCNKFNSLFGSKVGTVNRKVVVLSKPPLLS